LEQGFERLPAAHAFLLAAVDEEGRGAGDAQLVGLPSGIIGDGRHRREIGEAAARLVLGYPSRGEEIVEADDFGGEGFDLSDDMWTFGLAFEF
jgi:hypothetical protein